MIIVLSSMKAILLILAIVTIVSAVTTQHYTTQQRIASVGWYVCPDSCNCNYTSLYVYEVDTRTRSQGVTTTSNPPPYLYVYHNTFNYCSWTWSYQYSYGNQPLTGFFIQPNARSAQLTVASSDNVVASDSSPVTASLSWTANDANGNCNCRSFENFSGITSYRFNSRSSWGAGPVTGWISIGNVNYTVPGNTIGWIDDYGNKQITITV